MAVANQSDFLGDGGTYAAPQGTAPTDPDDLPNPNNPGGISNNELRRQHVAALQKLAATPYGTPTYAGGTATQYQVQTTPSQDATKPGSDVYAQAGYTTDAGNFAPTGAFGDATYNGAGQRTSWSTGSAGYASPVNTSTIDPNTGGVTNTTIPGSGSNRNITQTPNGLPAAPSTAAPTPSTSSLPAGASSPGGIPGAAAGGSQYTPTGTVDYSRYDQAATSYDRAINTFQAELDRLSGVDPFGNQAFLRKATDRAAAQAQGIAAGGLSTATARAGNMRQALNTAANVSAQGRDQMAIQRAQDQQAAEQQRLIAAGGIANVAGQRAQNEVQLAQTQTDAIQKNLDRALQGTEFEQKLTQQDVENLRQAAIAYSQIDQQRYATDAQYRASVDDDLTKKYLGDEQLQAAMAQIQSNTQMTQKDWLMGALGLATGAASGAVMKSDRRSKFDVRDPDLRDLQDFLGRTKGKLYRYKDPSAPGQRRGLNFGPMAQDLQKSKIGRTVVVEGKDGLYVDTGRLALADHAALAELAREVAELRGKVAS